MNEVLDSLLKAKQNQEQVNMFSHFYLNDAAVCLQCQAVFRMVEDCPACGCRTVWPLNVWVPQAESGAMILTSSGDWREEHAGKLGAIR